jgi:hypothetical protein
LGIVLGIVEEWFRKKKNQMDEEQNPIALQR